MDKSLRYHGKLVLANSWRSLISTQFLKTLNHKLLSLEFIESAYHDCFWIIMMVLEFQTRPYLSRTTFSWDHVLIRSPTNSTSPENCEKLSTHTHTHTHYTHTCAHAHYTHMRTCTHYINTHYTTLHYTCTKTKAKQSL